MCTMVNGTLLNFGKRYKDVLRVIFDHWPKLHLGLDVLINQKILKGVYCILSAELNLLKSPFLDVDQVIYPFCSIVLPSRIKYSFIT